MTIINAECGACFFDDRVFHVDASCKTHNGTITCDACGQPEAPELLDAKPTDGDWDGDYDRNECIACYGPGYDMLDWAHKALSVRPELATLYDAYIEPRRLAGIVWC